MRLIGILFSIARCFETRAFYRLTASYVLVLFFVTAANVYAQTDTQPLTLTPTATHSHANIAAAQPDHQHPEGATHEHNVEHLLELLKFPEQVDKAADEVLKLFSVKLKPGNTDPTMKLIVDAYQQDATQMVNSVVSWQAMKVSYVNSYANRMSEQDVAQLSHALRSPAWQKFSATQAEAEAEIQQNTKRLMETNMTVELTQLRTQLRDGLAAIQAKQSETN
jgi:hypothetical protein